MFDTGYTTLYYGLNNTVNCLNPTEIRWVLEDNFEISVSFPFFLIHIAN